MSIVRKHTVVGALKMEKSQGSIVDIVGRQYRDNVICKLPEAIIGKQTVA